MEALGKGNGGRGSLATPPPDLNTPLPPSKQEQTAARREQAQRSKALIADAEEDLVRAKATGASAATVQELDSQLRAQKLAARFQREQNMPEEEAIKKARSHVDLQNEAKARKEATKQQAAADKQAAEEKAKAEQAAQKETADQQKQQAADAAKAEKAQQKQTQAEAKAAATAKAAAEKKAAQETAAAAKAATKEEKEQETLMRSRAAYAQRAGHMAVGLAGQSAGVGDAISALTSINEVAKALGPEARAAILIATATAAVVAVQQQREFNAEERAIKDRGNRLMDAREFERAESFEGSASGSRNMAEGFKTERLRLEQEKAQLEHNKQFRWYAPQTWDIGGANKAAIGEVDDKIQRAKENEAKAREDAAKFARHTTAVEIDMEKKKAAGQYLAARGDQDKLTAWDAYRHFKDGYASDEDAEAGAKAKLEGISRERARGYDRLVTARDGVADTARVATAKHEQLEQDRASTANIMKDIHETMQKQHADMKQVATLKNFYRP